MPLQPASDKLTPGGENVNQVEKPPKPPPKALQARLSGALRRRRARGLLRDVRAPDPGAADFSSNDYLGLSRLPAFRLLVASFANGSDTGATGSRLLSGHSSAMAAAEATAAAFHNSDSALLFNSGYAANVSLLSCVPSAADAIVYDALVHASVHDGLRASRVSTCLPFAHNDVSAMIVAVRSALVAASGTVIVVVETVYSMDGDIAPVGAILDALDLERARTGRDVVLVADEAHAGGLFGTHGSGICAKYARHELLIARIITFGKAFGGHGAVVLCSHLVRLFLLNYARPLVYSTALPPHSIAAIRAAYAFSDTKEADALRSKVWAMRDRFRKQAEELLPAGVLLNSASPIQGVVVSGNRRCVKVAEYVRTKGFEVYPIRAPTVPAGSERLRVVLHAHNTEEQVDGLIGAIREALGNGKEIAAL